jgi:cytosine/adenosine deaminase-related metal-dependent hydrolase
MLFENLSIPGILGPHDICTAGNTISRVEPTGAISKKSEDSRLEFKEAMVFPGLINSHDHLDFNLFPQLGRKIFCNYREWGLELQQNFKSEIQQIRQIPQALRTCWGIYKNLINGFTTVVNHGDPLVISDSPILVVQENNILHSVGFERNWIWKLNNPFAQKLPYVVHVGEGTDKKSEKEIDKLITWNLFKRKLVGIHGVAMTASQAEKFEALVWCPASNLFMLNKTANIPVISKWTRILFGTDSTLTAGWNAWDHFRRARLATQILDQELFDTLTINAANVWNLPGSGTLLPGMKADLVIARTNAKPSWDSFFALNPKDIMLVMQEGKVRLYDRDLEADMKSNSKLHSDKFSEIRVGNSAKLVSGNLPGLLSKIRTYNPAIEAFWESN